MDHKYPSNIPANSKRQKFMPREGRIAFPPSESLLQNLLHKFCAGGIFSLFTSGGPILPKFGSSTLRPSLASDGTSRQVPTLAQPCFCFAEVSDSADWLTWFQFSSAILDPWIFKFWPGTWQWTNRCLSLLKKVLWTSLKKEAGEPYHLQI